MSRPDPIEYAERLYDAIRGANFSPISFLAFGNAVKDGTSLRNLPRMAAEPFMRIVGEMLDLEEDAGEEDGLLDVEIAEAAPSLEPPAPKAETVAAEGLGAPQMAGAEAAQPEEVAIAPAPATPTAQPERRRNGGKR